MSRLRALLVAAGVLALAASAAAGAGASGRAAGYPRAFAQTDDAGRQGSAPGKDALHRLQIVANLRQQQPSGPVVLLLGGSSARECTVSDTDWAAQVQRLGGPAVTVYNLGCRHDTYALDREIVELLPAGMPAIVYIGVNLGRFASPPSSPTVKLPAPVIPPPTYFQHIYSVNKKVQSASTKSFYVDYWLKRRWPEFRARYAYDLAVLEDLVSTCVDRGLHPVLLDLPRDLAIIGRAFDKPVAQYKAGCADISARYAIPWYQFVSAANLKDSDYFDLFHLVEPGRVKYQRLLSQKTVTLLAKYGLDEPPPTPSPSPTPSASPTPSEAPNPAGTAAP